MRLIDADKLYPDRMTKEGLAISQSQIANAETVEERKVGKWISDGHGHIVCTACNEVNVTIWKSKYCPCCGAEMVGDENEHTNC